MHETAGEVAHQPFTWAAFGPIVDSWSIDTTNLTPSLKPTRPSLWQFMDALSKLNKNTLMQYMSSLTDNEYVAQVIYVLATTAGVIVGLSKFIYTAWVENDMTNQTKTFIIKVLNVLDSGSTYLRNELSEQSVSDWYWAGVRSALSLSSSRLWLPKL